MTFERSCEVPGTPDQLDAAWLDARLRATGFLGSDVRVSGVKVRTLGQWNVAQPAILDVGYDPAQPETLPARFFVKLDATIDPMAHLFPGEAVFYTETMGRDCGAPRCFAAIRDPKTGHRCILLEDLSDTHHQPPWPLPPRFEEAAGAVDALAASHAQAWREGDIEETCRSVLAIDGGLSEAVGRALPDFLDFLGDRLSADQRVIVDRVASRCFEIKRDRVREGDALTRAHGDPHAWNFLYPNDPGRDRCVLIDWEDWRPNLAACDLAQMMALHWFPRLRARFEAPLFERYGAALSGRGIDYPVERLAEDYRLAHICNLHFPIVQHSLGKSADIWYPHLERWLMAYDDLNCAEII